MHDIKIGDQFHWLTVIGDVGLVARPTNRGSEKRDRKFRCQCRCGKVRYVVAGCLRHGQSRSCGCLSKVKKRYNYHGLKDHPLYGVWGSMKKRCLNSKSHHYHRYGGRGITICQSWLDSFLSFYHWSLANGYELRLQIDRINNNGNYEPSNCRWATRIVNGNNKENTRRIEWNGETKTLREWSEFTGLSFKLLECRFQNNKHWSIDRIFTEPSRGGRYKRHDKNLNRKVATAW